MKSSKTLRPGIEPVSTPLQPCAPEALQWDMQEIQLSVARRAYELFEMRHREHGHDWEDWFRAESELLRPVSIAMSESPERFSLHANVFGFDADEIKISIEPRRIAVLGRKKISSVVGEIGEPGGDLYPDQILRMVDIASDVDPKGATVELQSGILKFELPKIAEPEACATGAA